MKEKFKLDWGNLVACICGGEVWAYWRGYNIHNIIKGFVIAICVWIIGIGVKSYIYKKKSKEK